MAQQIVPPTRSIAEVVGPPWTPESAEDVFTVFAQVGGIYHEAGWYYGTCYRCSKGLVVHGGCFFCGICDKSCCYPVIRYRIHLHVRDHSGKSIFTMFNDVAEAFLDSAAHKFVNKLGIGSEVVPVEITALTGRFFAFTIKLQNYLNQDYNYHHLRVLKIYEVAPINQLIASPFNPGKANEEEQPTGPGSADTALSVCKGTCAPEVSTPAKKAGGRCLPLPSP